MQQIVIQGWVPTSLNKLIRMQHRQRHAAIKLDYEIIRAACLNSDAKAADGPRTVGIRFSGTKCDPDNLLKTLLDGLVRAKVLLDDSAQYCRLAAVVASVKGEPATYIELSDGVTVGDA